MSQISFDYKKLNYYTLRHERSNPCPDQNAIEFAHLPLI